MPNTVINQTLSELNYKSVKTPIISIPGNNTTKVLFKLITQIPKSELPLPFPGFGLLAQTECQRLLFHFH